MAPVYSMKGCLTCRRRKKKCDETKPTCLICSRLNLPCQWQAHDRAVNVRPVQIGPLLVNTPETQTQLLPTAAEFRPGESSVIARIPSTIVRFCTPAAGSYTRDMRFIMQLALTNLTVRNALTACFSAILPGHNSQLGPLNRESLGSALTLIRSRLSDPNTDFDDLWLLQIAIQYLGLLESVGPKQSADPSMHFVAQTSLYGRLIRRARSPVPHEYRILILESCVYHFAQLSAFTFDIDHLDQVWEQTDIYNLLLETNPEGEDCITRSPLLSGQYELWALAFEVHSLSRHAAADRPDKTVLAQKKERIKKIREGLVNYFGNSKHGTQAEKDSLVDNYHIHCIGLQIALTALEDASPERGSELQRLVIEGVQIFVDFEFQFMTYAGLVWPLQILACAIEDEDDWKNFEAQVSRLTMMLDAGHTRRLKSVMSQAVSARQPRNRDDEQDSIDDREALKLPGALHLLQRSDGLSPDWSNVEVRDGN